MFTAPGGAAAAACAGMEKRVVSPDAALASDIFDQFCSAATLKSMLGLYRRLCDTINLRPTHFPLFYPKLKVIITLHGDSLPT